MGLGRSLYVGLTNRCSFSPLLLFPPPPTPTTQGAYKGSGDGHHLFCGDELSSALEGLKVPAGSFRSRVLSHWQTRTPCTARKDLSLKGYNAQPDVAEDMLKQVRFLLRSYRAPFGPSPPC